MDSAVGHEQGHDQPEAAHNHSVAVETRGSLKLRIDLVDLSYLRDGIAIDWPGSVSVPD